MTEPKSIEEQIEEASLVTSGCRLIQLECKFHDHAPAKDCIYEMRLMFEKGAAFGRELGRKEAIEALREPDQESCGIPAFRPYWADWLSSRFAEEKKK